MTKITKASQLPPLRWVLMTVEQATEILLRNTHNRPVNERHLRKMTEDMEDNRFDPFACVQIIIGTDGVLLNGQKTLLAIVRSGCPQWVILIEKVPVASDPWLVMDNNQIRTLAQELQREGVPNAGDCAAIVNNLCRYEAQAALAGRMVPRNTEARRKWQEMGGRIQERVTDADRIARRTGFSSRAALGAVYILAEDMHPEAAAGFFERLDEGGLGKRGDPDPIHQLGRHIETTNRHRSHFARHGADNLVDAAWLVLAFNAFLTGDRRTITYRPHPKTGKLPDFPRLLTPAEVNEILGIEAETH
jgi:hypothetical protein